MKFTRLRGRSAKNNAQQDGEKCETDTHAIGEGNEPPCEGEVQIITRWIKQDGEKCKIHTHAIGEGKQAPTRGRSANIKALEPNKTERNAKQTHMRSVKEIYPAAREKCN